MAPGTISTTPPAVVLGLFETGLAVARALSSSGVRVTGVSYQTDWARWSRRFERVWTCPHPLDREEAFVEFMRQKFEGCQPRPALFITDDEFVAAVSRHRARLRECVDATLPPEGVLEGIADKYRLAILAQGCGIDTPKTWAAEAESSETDIAHSITYPALVKGRSASQWRRVFLGGRKAFVAATPESLLELIARVRAAGVEPLVQEVIPGPATRHFKVCVHIASTGQLTHAFALQKIRQNPPGFGIGSAVRSVHDPELMQVGQSLFVGLQYRGVGSAEFKRDDRDGRLKLIEVNPRFWQQCGLATACGVDFPLAQYLDLSGQDARAATGGSRDYETGVVWISPFADMESVRALRREGHLTFRDWRRSVAGRKVFPDWSASDPLPFCARMVDELVGRAKRRAHSWRTSPRQSASAGVAR